MKLASSPHRLTGRLLIAATAIGFLNFAAHAVDYSSTVLTDAPLVYYRLSEPGPATSDVATNSGSLGANGNGVHHVGVTHPVAGAIAGSANTAAGYTAIDPLSTDGGSPTVVPYNSVLNPGGSFTVEVWLNPAIDGNANAQTPMINRYIDSTTGNRFGWDFFQRDAGTGWNFRMFNGTSGSTKVFDITGGAYTVGSWSHLVAVYDASIPSATLYLNGVQVAQSTTPNGVYAPNTVSPLAVGGFPVQLAGNGYENPFIGSMDEWALYTNALSAAQVLVHYVNGTNAARVTPYENLVTTDGAVEYLRLDEPAHDLATNSGSLGATANGVYASTGAAVAGPQSPVYLGLETTNRAQDFSGSDYVELGNPAALNFSGVGGILTLEAWILPAASQGFESYIIAHGGNDDWSGEVYLRIENGNYQVGSNNGHASSAVPVGDLGGSNWVHLAGTYDGFNWVLYRNGVPVATTTDFTGPNAVNNGNWAIGVRGRWKTFKDTLDRQYNGRIDEVAIYNSALSGDRIQAHYYAGRYATLNPTPTITQQPASMTNFAGSPAAFTVSADGAAPLSYQWYKGATPVGTDSPTLAFAGVQFSDAGSYTVTVSNLAGATNSATAVLTVPAGYGSIVCQDLPAAYYPLNETSGAIAYDRFSGAYNGSYQWVGSSVTLGVAGPSASADTAARFNAGGRVWIGNPTALDQSGQMTLEAWIKPASTGGDQYIIAHGIDWTNMREVTLRIESGAYQVGVWYWDGSSWQDHASMAILSSDLNTWVHLVGTYDGTSWRLYRNGTLVDTKTTGGPIGLSQDWAIGGAGSAERWFDGGICQAAIYTTALTESQIKTHYAVCTPNPLLITSSGGVVTVTWSAGTLQHADDAAGPFTDVSGATSPYNPPSGFPKKFYRLKF